MAALLLFLAVTVTQLLDVGVSLSHWYNSEFNWRSREYKKLTGLHSDFTLAAFQRVIGPPTLEIRQKRWTTYVYHGRDWWAQAITHHGASTVGFYSVTSCSSSFRPTFQLSGIGPITLYRSNVLERPNTSSALHEFRGDFAMRYMVPVDSVGSFFAITPDAHPFNFKSYAWGANGACPGAVRLTGNDYQLFRGNYAGTVPLSKISRAMASRISVNTFAEWGPTEYKLPPGMLLGVDEVSINTIAGRCIAGCLGNVDSR